MRARSQTRSNRLLAGFILATAGAIAISGVLSERDLYRAQYAGAESELTALSRLFVEQADNTVDLTDTVLLGLRRMLETDVEHGVSLVDSLLSDASLGADMRHFSLIAADGRYVAGVGAPAKAGGAGADAWRDPVFRRHVLSGSRDLVVGAPQPQPGSGVWSIPFSRRLDDADGNFSGVIVAYVELAHFTDFHARAVSNDATTVAVFGLDGALLTLYPNYRARPGTVFRLSGVAARRIATEDAFVYRFPSPADQAPRLGALLKSTRHPMLVVSSRRETDIAAAWWGSAQSRILARTAGTVAILLFGFTVLWQIRRRQAAVRALLQQQHEFKVLAEGSGDAVLRLTADGRIDYASPAALPILGHAPADLVGTRLLDLCRGDGAARFEQAFAETLAGADGRVSVSIAAEAETLRRVTATLRRVETRHEPGVIAVLRDDTEGYLAHQRLLALAVTDPLTGLANRRSFAEVLEAEWQRAKRDGRPLSLLFVDADRFKAFNDTNGHQAGDRCLKIIAGTLAAGLRRPADFAARYGGEEFVMLLPATDSAGARHTAERIRAAVEAQAIPRSANAADGVVTVSIGVATEQPGSQSRKPETLVAHADHALYAAKASGRNRVWVDGEAVEPSDIAWDADEPPAVTRRAAG